MRIEPTEQQRADMCGLSLKKYRSEVADCIEADRRMKDIDQRNLLLSTEQKTARHIHLANERKVLIVGEPEWFKAMHEAKATYLIE